MAEREEDDPEDASETGDLVQQLISLSRPLALGFVLAIFAVPAGLDIWEAALGFTAFTIGMLLWPSVRKSARARALAEIEAAKTVIHDYTVIDALDFPTIIFDQTTQVVRQNMAAQSLIGAYPDRASLSARIRSPSILELVSGVLESNTPESVEHTERVPAERWYEVRVAPVLEAVEPGKRLFVMTFRDMTEARRMDRMRTDFVANASHELRTPLASLMGFIETMQGPARNDEAARTRFFAIMLDQAQRMARLIDDLLSLSRLEMRAHVAPSGTVDLVQTVIHVVDTLRPMAHDLDVLIEFSPPKKPINVIGDKDELIQVFSNLVENACKYGQSGKKVDITIVDSKTDGPKVTVKDYGPGIAKEHLPRLTERFYRVDVETSRSKKGTGLGLAIVKHILARHRARLVVRSTPGEGAAFTVKFNPSALGKISLSEDIYQ